MLNRNYLRALKRGAVRFVVPELYFRHTFTPRGMALSHIS